MEKTDIVKKHFNQIASKRDYWKKNNFYYHQKIEHLHQFLIPKGRSVLEIGCGTGDLLASLKPKYGIGVDIAEGMTEIAKRKYPRLKFVTTDAQNLNLHETFDYVILSDLIGNLEDTQKAFEELHKVSNDKTRIIITYHNFTWEPILTLSEKLGFKMPQPLQSWLSGKDIENLIYLANFEVVKKGNYLLLPINISFISNFFNKYIARLPFFKNLCLVQYFVARKIQSQGYEKKPSVSVVIPARNEEGNIEQAVLRTPNLGSNTEIIFIEGHSKDNTKAEIRRVIKKYANRKDIRLVSQGKGMGKGDAVRRGFAKARGDVLIILDADLTVAPEELPKFYNAIKTNKGELVNGNRLVYPLEKDSMRFLNIIGNKLFSLAFTFLLDQPIKDTLCGTKVLSRENYREIARNRSYFGDFDPFGDYDLIFGASKLNLKIIEIPIRYGARTYGTTNISRFKHGLLLLKMTLFAARRIKFFL